MELMEAIRTRRSIRKYKTKPVPEEDIEYVLQAARLAPSWANRQCWRYITITDENLRKKIMLRDWAAQAPVVIVGCADPARSGDKDGKPYYMLDMGISMEHLMLAASERGLGTCWIGGQIDEKTVREVLGIPDNIRVVAMTPLGYPDETPAPKDRKSLEEITGRNKW
ncbi:MAG: nitroreductase family protein [archaeon]